MTERWILNASPLIVLARIGHEDLFLKLSDAVVVPQAVAVEVDAGPEQDQARTALAAGRFRIVETPPPTDELLAWNLGAGETAVLSLAVSEPGWTAILDDAAARRCARSLGVSVKGTLAIVILAKQRKLMPSSFLRNSASSCPRLQTYCACCAQAAFASTMRQSSAR